MALELVVMWVLVGLFAGGLAGFVLKSGSYGPIGDLILGLVGSVLGGSIFQILGIFPGAWRPMLGLVAFAGAAGVLVAQRKLWRPTVRPRRRRSVASGAWRVEQE